MENSCGQCLFFLTLLLFRQCLANGTNDVLKQNASTGNKPSVNETNHLTLTETIINQLAGRKVNLKKLMEDFALICPIQDYCGVEIDRKYLFDKSVKTIFPECKECSCFSSCIDDTDPFYCCPDAFHGYVNYECTNTTIYTTNEFQYKAFLIVSSCLKEYQGNTSMIEKCSSLVNPCTSIRSGIVYKNQFCAVCNKDNECVPWTIKASCEIDDLDFPKEYTSLTSVSEFNDFIHKYNCTINFMPAEDIASEPVSCSMYQHNNKSYVGKCSVTGLWDIYDADIEWACKRLFLPYKEFRNVFCYICNPSISSTQNARLIDRCENSLERFESRYNAIIEGCEILPSTTRLKPFKNIYCYVCHLGQIPLVSDAYLSMETAENNEILDLKSQLSFYIWIWGENKISSLEQFIRDIFHDNFTQTGYGTSLRRKNRFYNDAIMLDAIAKSYKSVCGTETICGPRTNVSDKVYGNPVCGKCDCESTCAENYTCCPELLFQKEPYSCIYPQEFPSLKKNNDSKNDQKLLVYGSDRPFKVIDVCLDSLEKKCSSSEHSDILTSIPVMLESNTIYKNIYCYACNNNVSDVFLKFQVLCDIYIENKLFKSTKLLLEAVSNFCSNVLFIPLEGKKCRQTYDATKAGRLGGIKYVRIKSPPSLLDIHSGDVRGLLDERRYEFVNINLEDRNKIVKIVYSACNQTGNLTYVDSIIKTICESEDENILSLPEYRIENRVYKNFACFLCNPDVKVFDTSSIRAISDCLINSSAEWWYQHNEDLEELCHVMDFSPRWFPFKNMYCSECNLPPLQLVDVTVNVISSEKYVKMYTYIFSLSRHDFERILTAPRLAEIPKCSKGTYDYSLNECRPVYCGGGFQLSNNTCVPILETASKVEYEIYMTLQYLNREMNNTSTEKETNTFVIIDSNVICAQVLLFIVQSIQKNAEYAISSECQPSVMESTFTELSLNNSKLNPITLHITLNIAHAENVSLILRTFLEAQNKKYHIANLLDSVGQYWSMDFVSEIMKKKFNIFEDIAPYDLGIFPILVDKFLLCPHVRFNLNETFLNIETDDIRIIEKNLSFFFGEYKLTNEYVSVCVEDFNQEIPRIQRDHTSSSFRGISFSVFDLVCLSVSIGCLLLTIVTYSLFSSLRTLPGKNLLTLCIFLLCAQALLQFGLDGPKGSTWCKVIGISMHCSWMSTFCAMNICSFHTFRVFAFADSLNRPFGRYLFVKYLIYIVGFPLVCVLMAVSITLVTSDGSELGYGETYCFISDFYIFLGTFLVPASVIFMSNIVFFALAFHKIRTIERVQSTNERNNFYICLKLCAIVGVAWPLLILDNIIQVSWFSFVASGVNSLQGMFILFSYVMNMRVTKLYISCFQTIPTRGTNDTIRTSTRTDSTNTTSSEPAETAFNTIYN